MTTNADFHAGFSYPIELVGLCGRPVLIAGAGKSAAVKVPALIAAGAKVHVVAPEISEEMTRWFFEIERIERRRVRAHDVLGKALVIAATNDRDTNKMLVGEARTQGVLASAVDDLLVSDFFSPAIVRRGPVHFAIGTSGTSPLLAGQLRRVLDVALPESVSIIGDLFARLRRSGLKGSSKRMRLLRALADPKLSRLVDLDRFADAEKRLEEILREDEEPFPPGSVSIVGAGPGSKSLLTVRALDRLQRADLILHDALVDAEVLALALPCTRVVCVGRRTKDPEAPKDQRETIAMMIDRAKNGDRVVRLHGGDPLVFGRGGEEIEALSKTDVPFEIVPGVSAILAVAAAARVPLTLRRIARGFTVRTGHLESGEQAPSLERSQETVVVVMGLGALDRIAQRLIDEGRSPDLGAIVVSRASRRDQRIVRATLGTIAERVRAADVPSPATFLCGPQL
jgi:uroporphyrin-III C-methyltransferase/precorrin-2 dehydrogenase/sirohydrochlorin ferrochelatase